MCISVKKTFSSQHMQLVIISSNFFFLGGGGGGHIAIVKKKNLGDTRDTGFPARPELIFSYPFCKIVTTLYLRMCLILAMI